MMNVNIRHSLKFSPDRSLRVRRRGQEPAKICKYF
jgi:hypothetical protein